MIAFVNILKKRMFRFKIILDSGGKSMKETTEVTEKRISLCSQKKHKNQEMKIMRDQRNLNKLIQSEEIRKMILGNTFPKRRSIQAFNIEKLGKMLEIGSTFEFTEGGGKAMFNKLLNLNNLCVLCGKFFTESK